MATNTSQPPMDRPDGQGAGRNRHRLGRSFIFPPEVIDDIHIKSELGRYRMRGFSDRKSVV